MRTAPSSSAPAKSIRFAIDKDHYRRLEIEPGVTICHLYPTLVAWVGRTAPDNVNPRSHDEASLGGSVPKAIEQTIRDNPDDFYLANRGATVLAASVSFDPEKQFVEIVLTDHDGEAPRHGVADGGTTDAVIAKVQREIAEQCEVDFRDLTTEQIPPHLQRARVHLEVIVGLGDRERIERLVQGRNTSRQVKTWTMEDFKGSFDWIKEILGAESSEFKGKIGYEENAAAPVNILEVLSILTLFHPSFDAKSKAPTVAYSSKGRMDKRLTDPDTAQGYRALAPIIKDVLKLHDYVYANFQPKYREAVPNGRLGRLGKTNDRIFPNLPKTLPLTNTEVQYAVPNGVLYPLLASLRALVRFPSETNLNASWKTDPFEFFDKNGAELMDNLMSQLDTLQNNPQTMGKTKTVYIALHDRARLLLAENLSSN